MVQVSGARGGRELPFLAARGTTGTIVVAMISFVAPALAHASVRLPACAERDRPRAIGSFAYFDGRWHVSTRGLYGMVR